MFQAQALEDGTEWKAVEMLKELKIGSAIDAVENKIMEERALELGRRGKKSQHTVTLPKCWEQTTGLPGD